MRKFILIGLAALAGIPLIAQVRGYNLLTDTTAGIQQLEEGFRNPPPESRLRCYWWWLNSMATKESITRDLQEMKAKGYGGASLVDAGSSNYQVAAKTPAGPVFMSPAWMELYKWAVREADRVGIELSVNLGSGWNPGGPSITPEFALKKIVWTETDIEGGHKIRIELPRPEMELFYKDIVVQAIPKISSQKVGEEAIFGWKRKTLSEPMGWKGVYPLGDLQKDYPGDGSEMAVRMQDVIDLTSHFNDGTLEWDAPPGTWTIIRYGYTCTGARTSTNSDGWEGLSVDHLSPEAFQVFSSNVILPLIEAAQSAGKSLRFLQTDSWEMGTVNWTEKFPDEFLKFRGYDMMKYLPAMAGRIVETRQITDRFLHDFRQTVGDCVAENHYRLLYNLAHRYGLGIHPESGGPHSAPVDALKVMGISDFPQGEFWAVSNTHRVKDDERLSVRQSASVAHTNGKRFVAAEGPTSIGPQWERSPKDLKGNLDRIFCSGVNRIVWHTFTSSPREFGLPGNEYFAGTHLNPNVTWWKQAGDFIGYLNRTSYLLQQGLFVADVLCYYGDDVPNFVFLKSDIPELKFGYDWDKCSSDVLLNRVSINGEQIVLPDGMTYGIMMLPAHTPVSLEVLRKMEQFVSAGMTLVGQKPEAPSGLVGMPGSEKEFKEIADRLWGDPEDAAVKEKRVGKGHVIWGRNINDVLASMGILPDFNFKSQREDTSLDYIHRKTGAADIYFVTNRFARKGIDDFQYRYLTGLPDRFEQVEAEFRVTGKVPVIWDPLTGMTTEILHYQIGNGITTIPLDLAPEGSVFVVFRKSPERGHIISIECDKAGEHPSVYRDAHAKYFDAPRAGNYRITWSDGKMKTLVVPGDKLEIPVEGAWKVRFNPEWGGPKEVKWDQLKSWTDSNDPGIKYYSGSAGYLNTFNLSAADLKDRKVYIDLGEVQEMASLTINGHPMPVAWCTPFRFDITPYVQKGSNTVEAEVVNLWPNRLIGDGKLPENERLTKTNINKFNGKDAEKYLRRSGLIGPVRVILVPHFILKE